MKVIALLKDRKGNSSVISFLIVLPLILSLSFNPILMYLDAQKYQRLDHIVQKYLTIMESEGGLTTSRYIELIENLTSIGCDISKTTIDYTPYPVDFGNEVRLGVTTQMKLVRISILRAGGANVQVVTARAGPYYSVSKKNIDE